MLEKFLGVYPVNLHLPKIKREDAFNVTMADLMSFALSHSNRKGSVSFL